MKNTPATQVRIGLIRMIGLSALMALGAPASLFAQGAAPRSGSHRHDGFFLSISPGIAAGGTVFSEDLENSDGVTFRGIGPMLDLKIGAAVVENLIISFDAIGRNISRPDFESQGETFETDEDLILSDGNLGLGITYYFMPANVFLSGTLGLGRMTLYGAPFDERIESENGLSAHFKMGKEWWIGESWALGLSGGFGFIQATDPKDRGADYQGEFASHKFYVLFNTTFN